MADEEVYEVESVRQARVSRRRLNKINWQYFVKWIGYPEAENTWEPAENLKSADIAVNTFWASVNLGGRDIADGSAFKSGEHFAPGDGEPDDAKVQVEERPEEEIAETEEDTTPSISTKLRSRTKPVSTRKVDPPHPSPRKSTRHSGASAASRRRKSSPLPERESEHVLESASQEGRPMATPARRYGRHSKASTRKEKSPSPQVEASEKDEEEQVPVPNPRQRKKPLAQEEEIVVESSEVEENEPKPSKRVKRGVPRNMEVNKDKEIEKEVKKDVRRLTSVEDSDDDGLSPLKPRRPSPTKTMTTATPRSPVKPGTPTRRSILPLDMEDDADVSHLVHAPGTQKRKLLPKVSSKASSSYVEDSELEQEVVRKKRKTVEAAEGSLLDVPASPKLDNEASLFSDDEDGKEKPKPVKDTNALSSHRARKAKPLIKMMDDRVGNEALDSAIPIKQRLLARQAGAGVPPPPPSKTSHSPTPSASGSSMHVGSLTTPVASPSRYRPGGSPERPNATPPVRMRSSLLTFAKGTLLSVKGSFSRPTPPPAREPTVEENDRVGDNDVLMDVDEGPAPPALTGKELLDLAGFDQEAADALPDFVGDDDEVAQSTPVVAPAVANPERPAVRPSFLQGSSWGLTSFFGSATTVAGLTASNSDLPMTLMKYVAL